jgi:SAM-dependent methyltransferase
MRPRRPFALGGTNAMGETDGVWRWLGRQLRQPSGPGAALVGPAMALANRQPNRAAIDALDIGPTETVLELGFGPGHALGALTARASRGKVLGIDHSAAMLAQAMRRNRRAIAEGRLQVRGGRFDALPWPAGCIDKVLAVNVVYFFRADGAELREARRVLRPGGRVAVFAADSGAMARWKFAGPDTHRPVDRQELLRLFASGGFGAGEVTVSPIALPLGITGLLGVAQKGACAEAAGGAVSEGDDGRNT